VIDPLNRRVPRRRDAGSPMRRPASSVKLRRLFHAPAGLSALLRRHQSTTRGSSSTRQGAALRRRRIGIRIKASSAHAPARTQRTRVMFPLGDSTKGEIRLNDPPTSEPRGMGLCAGYNQGATTTRVRGRTPRRRIA
jgi:hypothetical protein